MMLSDDDQVRQKHCTICRRPTTCYVDTYIDVFVNRATVDELRRSGFSFHCGLGKVSKQAFQLFYFYVEQSMLQRTKSPMV